MDWLVYIIASLFTLIGAACIASIILSIPGTWIMLLLALLIQWLDPLWLPQAADGTQPHTFRWWLLGVCAVLALAGEAIELAAGAAGAKSGGGSRRGVIGALLGGIIGAIALTPLIPIPVLGTLIGAIIGTFAGAVIGETTGAQPKTLTGSVTPAFGATIGRVIGTVGKMAVAIVIWLALSVAVFWP